MKTDEIRRFLELHAHSFPATKNADEMLAVLDDVDAEVVAANNRAQDLANLMADQTARLRDTFAAAALTGLLADSRVDLPNADAYAKKAYQAADAMLKAREGK